MEGKALLLQPDDITNIFNNNWSNKCLIKYREYIKKKFNEIKDKIKNIVQPKNSKDELKLKYAFQPIYEVSNFINIYSYKIYAYECLIRNTEYYNMSIYSFLNFFAKEKKSFLLHLYFFYLALKSFPLLKENNTSYLFFNIFPSVFTEEEFNFYDFYSIMFFFNFPAYKVIFEITEKNSIDIVPEIKKKITEYKENFPIYQKISFALDDFGSGVNNGKFFYELKPDYVKIDRFFIENQERFNYLKNLIYSLKEHSKVVIEGIENEEEFIRGLDLNADLYQGFFLRKPFIPMGE